MSGSSAIGSSGADGPQPPSSSGGPRPGAPGRSAAEIRRDIDAQQAELASSVQSLRTRVNELTDWRRQLDDHRDELIKGAAVAGFVIGGLIALRRRRKR